MRALGFDVKKDQVLKILKDYDRESTGKITFDDFNEVCMYLLWVNFTCWLHHISVDHIFNFRFEIFKIILIVIGLFDPYVFCHCSDRYDAR